MKEDDDFIILKSHITYNYLCLSAIDLCLVLLNYQEPELIYPFNGSQSQYFVKEIQIKYLEKKSQFLIFHVQIWCSKIHQAEIPCYATVQKQKVLCMSFIHRLINICSWIEYTKWCNSTLYLGPEVSGLNKLL